MQWYSTFVLRKGRTMPTKYLDLDPIRQPIGEFKLGGKKYKVWPLKIRQLINMQAAPTTGIPAQDMVALVDTLHETVPDCPRELLENLDMNQLNVLTAWVNTNGQDNAEKNGSRLSPTGPETTTVALSS